MSAPFFASERWWAVLLIASALATVPVVALGDPPTLERHAAIYDPARQSMVVFGGAANSQPTNDTWELGLSLAPQWAPLAPVGTLPLPRVGHTAVYDPLRDRMVIFGGLGPPGNLNDAWALSLSASLSWDSLEATGTPPQKRAYHSAIYDPVGDRVVIFGGLAGGALNDVWCLWLSPSPRWELLAVPGPGARFGHSAVYDSRRRRMVVFGGNFNDVLALSLDGSPFWRQLQPSGTPPVARTFHAAIYDSLGDRMIVFGGVAGQNQNDLWSLSFTDSTWSPLSASANVPSVRAYHSGIFDSKYDRMLIFGGVENLDEPTWGLALGSTPRWSRLSPTLQVSTADLVLAVTVGDKAAVPFTISNVGLEPLEIAQLLLPAPDLQLSTSAPLHLDWTAMVPETLTIAADSARTIQDSLVIVSNDPRAPRQRVTLRGVVHGLDFSTSILGNPAEAPLGVSLLVVTTPADSVRVEGGTLYYRIAHTSSPFDSISLTRLGTDFIGAIPGSSVTEDGIEYFVQVKNGTSRATRPIGAPAVVDSQSVAGPMSFTAFARPNTNSGDFQAGLDVEVEADLPPGAVFRAGAIHFRQGGEASDQVDSLAIGPSGRPLGVIPGAVVGPSGVEYWLEVETLKGTLQSPIAGAPPQRIRTRAQNLVENTVHPALRYRLLSVPLDFESRARLDAMLIDQFGTTNGGTNWRAYAYDPISAGNIEFSTGLADTTRFEPIPGRAFWLISRQAHAVDTYPFPGLSTSTAAEDTIFLAQGWNLFGDPFDFPVAWAEVSRDTDVVSDPVAFDPALGRIGEYAAGTPTVLVPFEGYFIHATQPSTLRVPPRRAPVSASTPAARADGRAPRADRSAAEQEPGGLMRFALRAWNDQAMDASCVFGLQSAAAPGSDRFDLLKPPAPPGPWVRVAFVHSDWQERSGEYRSDFRSPESKGETWEIEVRSSTPGDPVTVGLSEIVPPSSDLAIRLIDREQGSSIDLFRGSGRGSADAADDGNGSMARYQIVPFQERAYRLAIIAGNDAYVAQATQQALTLPIRVSLDPCAPNPFRIATRVRFGLPRAARASLEIYSVLGQRVAKPLDMVMLSPGYHTVIWEGTTSNGNRAPNGVYLMRLVVDGEVLTGRLVLVR